MSPLPQTIHQLSCKRIAVAMGIFDGVHLGHQKIIQQLIALAQETEATPVALFFAPHPKEVLFGTPPLFLTSTVQKAELLRQYGAEQVICMPFTKELAAKQPDEFLSLFLPAPPIVTGFCVGKNWRFGCKNAGDATTLANWTRQYGLQSRLVEQVCHNGEPISSTRIRAEITAGNLKEAAAMLVSLREILKDTREPSVMVTALQKANWTAQPPISANLGNSSLPMVSMRQPPIGRGSRPTASFMLASLPPSALKEPLSSSRNYISLMWRKISMASR